jgi:hypothetical protein
VCDQFASLISSAENTRPKPAATATAATTVVSAGENVDHGLPLEMIGREYVKRPAACQGKTTDTGCNKTTLSPLNRGRRVAFTEDPGSGIEYRHRVSWILHLVSGVTYPTLPKAGILS